MTSRSWPATSICPSAPRRPAWRIAAPGAWWPRRRTRQGATPSSTSRASSTRTGTRPRTGGPRTASGASIRARPAPEKIFPWAVRGWRILSLRRRRLPRSSADGTPARRFLASKYLRDPVHGSIGFDKDREKLVIDLINTREFQRLRRIRQLGALFLTFHGAEHTRFTHSLGVAYMARRIFDALLAAGQVQQKGRALERTRLVAIVAALLHDLGHGPFSHLYEKVFNDRRHEEWTGLIIKHGRGEVGRLLRRAGMVEEVLGVYGRTYRPAFVSDLVSSQLDADRLDYLLRDSFMTGVAYGKYDLEWILTNLGLARRGGRDAELRLAINGLKGYHAAEQFVIGRYLMYQQVYYHKTSRSAEQMIRTALQRLVDAHGETGRFPDPCPASIRRLIETRGNLPVEDYLRLDD